MPAMLKCTPILHVDAIEPCLDFWTERLGFEVTARVPAGDALGFAIVSREAVEVMYQTRAGVEQDLGDASRVPPLRGTMLFIEVDDIDAIERAMEGAEVYVSRRRTFYGADELFVREPGGNVIGFAQMVG